MEKVINIIYRKGTEDEDSSNSVFRSLSEKHEAFLTKPSECKVETVVAVASPLTCCTNEGRDKHGCYSAE